jgi:predicted Zn-dependent peptidase
MAAGLNALTERFGPGLDLLGEILLTPRFDSDALEVWRGQEIDRVMRREDDPSSLAISEFNRLMFGEHPVGWVMTPEDLTPERFSTTRLRRVHTSIVCRDRLMLGLSGDLTWEEAEPILRRFLEPWPSCEVDLPAPPVPELRRGGGVFVLAKVVDQSTVIVAGPGGVLQGDSPDYFASRIADYLLGASGFGSRLLSRLRADEGLAYSAYSIWTASPRHEGIVGAATATGAERTVQATRLVVQTLEEMRSDPPDANEVGRAREQIATGYVFAFGSAAQIVARRMAYRAQELPPGWLERYLEALDEVTPDAVRRVVDAHLDPSSMTVLIVGDPARFDPGLDLLGTVFQLSPDGTIGPWITPSSAPGGGQ